MARLITPSSFGWRSRLLTSLILMAVAMSTAVAPAARAQPADPQPELPPVDIVVLVDESRSLSEADVVQEKEAARSIALSALSPASTIAVVGFGSSEADGQSAVDVVCPPTVLDTAQNLDAVTVCINELHRRTPQEGDNTDHLAALKQARSYLDNGVPRAKIVFLLTDGELRVPNTEAYGRDAEDRKAFALKQIEDTEKPRLVAAGAQVWPLGFGKANLNELARFAAGRSCDPKLPAPAAEVISDPAELSSAVLKAFSSAACVRVDSPSTASLGQGKTVDLKVKISPIASDSAIIVNKRDSRINVTYLDPQDRNPATDPDPESTFQFSGQGTETEALRIGDPEAGTWTVRLTSHGNVNPQEVAATVVYQSAVSAVLTSTPPQPAAGQDVEIDMQIRARKQAITDPAVLADLTFTADLAIGRRTSAPVTLTDPDEDGTFSGSLAVPPDATGNLRITGRVSGLGIGGDERTWPTRVSPGTDPLQADIDLNIDGPIGRGGSVSGRVEVTNQSGQPRRLRLVIDQLSPGAAITVEPATFDVVSGGTQQPVTLHFGAGTVFGPNQAALQVVDDTDPAQQVAQRLFTVDVEPPPGWLARFWWVLVLVAVVLVIGVAALLMARRSRSQRMAVRGLRVELHRDGLAISKLEPADPDAPVLRFSVNDDRFTTPRLTRTDIGDAAAYALRRNGDKLLLETPSSGPQHVRPGEPVPDGASERTLVIHDERAPSVRTPAAPPFASSSPGGPQPPPGSYPGATAGPPGPFASRPPSPFGGPAAGPSTPGDGPTYT
jgi:von Willebrand factor type A domain